MGVIKSLGTRRRAGDLIACARHIVKEHQGEVPSDLDSLMKIKGVGRYVGSCVLAFAFGKSVPMVDSNVERVLCRIRGIENPDRKEKQEVWLFYERLAPRQNIRDFHCALIDLSHSTCRSRFPACPSCALSSFCQAAPRWIAASRIMIRGLLK